MSQDAPARGRSRPGAFHDLPRRQVIATMAGVIACLLLASLDQTIVATAMPRIVAELSGFDHYADVVTAYMVALTAAVPIVGKLSDLYGRKRFLLAGVAIFLAGSALCGSAQSMNQLVGFRGLQGLGAGFTQAMAFTTIADLFPPAQRGRVSGIMGAVFGLSSVIGPAAGGLLTDGPGWRYAFYLNLPLGLAAGAILIAFFPDIRPERARRRLPIDYLGALTLVAAVVPLLLALSWGGRDFAWGSTTIELMLGVAGVMTVAFLLVERRAADPILPLPLLRGREVATSSIAASLASAALFGTSLFVPLFIQGVIGTTATRSGTVTMPMMLAIVGSSSITGQLISRTGRYRAFGIAGVLLTAIGLVLLSRMDVDTSYGEVVFNIVVMGVGLGATFPVFTLAVQNAVDPRQVGVATSALQFFRSVGGALGAAVFGAVLVSRYAPAFRAALPEEIGARVPPDVLARLQDPQALMNQESGRAVPLDAIGLAGDGALESIHAAIREALALSLQDVFLVGALALAAGTAVTLLLRDRPLRKSNRVDIRPVEDRGEAEPD